MIYSKSTANDRMSKTRCYEGAAIAAELGAKTKGK
jgi:hypothetical protein